MIKITYYEEVIDNWGRTESSSNPDSIAAVLRNDSEWSDDMHFEDANGRVYFIDDLIGQTVLLSNGQTISINE